MTKRNTQQGVSDLTQSRNNTMSNLLGIRQAAAKDRRLQFTALFHHITPYLLKDSFFQLKRKRQNNPRPTQLSLSKEL